MKTDLKDFKELIEKMVRRTFSTVDFIEPTVFFLLQDNVVRMHPIPPERFENNIKKNQLALEIRNVCKDPLTRAAAIVAEVNIRNKEGIKKYDGLIIIFSCYEEEISTLYRVDCENRKILELDSDTPGENTTGRFSGFFRWEKN